MRPNLGWSTSSNPWLGDSAPTTTHGTPSLWSTIVTDFRAFFFPFFFFPFVFYQQLAKWGETRPRRRQIGKMTVTQSDRRQPPTVSQSMCLPSGAEDGTGVDLPFNGIAAGRDFRFCYLAKRAECPDSLLGRVHVQPSSGIMLSTPPSHDPHDPAECISGCSLLDPLARNTSGDFAECACHLGNKGDLAPPEVSNQDPCCTGLYLETLLQQCLQWNWLPYSSPLQALTWSKCSSARCNLGAFAAVLAYLKDSHNA